MAAQDRDRICANCLCSISAHAGSGNRGPDIAWFMHCNDCAAVVSDQMELVESRPHGAKIDILECRWCGTSRSCRPGWRTRCMVCLDPRTNLDGFSDPAAVLEPADLLSVAAAFEVEPKNVTAQHVLQLENYLQVLDRLESRQRPGWTVLATDSYGLPFPGGKRGMSHGTWARHDACGQVQVIAAGRPECGSCPPQAHSRTHRARAEDPHLLYLVRHGGVMKFGHGDDNRVRAHLRAGCTVVRVLSAPHREVVAAELAIKRRYRDRVATPDALRPASFGSGTEVVSGRCRIDIGRYLTGDHVLDVTHRFRED